MPLKSLFVKYMPFLGKYKRYIDACIQHMMRTKKTYSQHKEDLIIYTILKENNIHSGTYIDVGANHPMRISNTYMLYRNGFKGITIEPNFELFKLHRKFRNQDISLNLGCSEKPSLELFNVYNTPVLGNFSSNNPAVLLSELKLMKQLYVPILTLDIIIEKLFIEKIVFLNIDVEGMDYKVLLGGIKSLSKVFIICIESSSDVDINKISALLHNNNFYKVKMVNCNHIYLNKTYSF